VAGSSAPNHALMTGKVTTTDMTQYMVDNTNIITIVMKSVVHDRLQALLDFYHHRTPQVEKAFGGGKTQEGFSQ
jgi:hypothetical protein